MVMNLSSFLGLLNDVRMAFATALLPTLFAIWANPSILLHPHRISDIFSSSVWRVYGDNVDEAARKVKADLLPRAEGVVLDVGAGHGHSVKYLDRNKVTKYIALEPNALMHPYIKQHAAQEGFTESAGTLLILPYGVEEMMHITDSLSPHSVDTLLSVLTLCSVPNPQLNIGVLVTQVLKPGGQFLFYEHVLNPRGDVAWWQRFWTPIWAFTFGGCRLDRPTHKWIEDMGVWKSGDDGEGGLAVRIWGKEGESEESLFLHRVGRLVKES